jgi:thioredoxin 1
MAARLETFLGMANLLAVTTETFDPGGTPLLVDFGAPRCPPCRMIAPHVEKIAEQFAGRVRVVTCNVDENPELGDRFSISSIPMLLMFKDGKVVGQLVGAVSKARIEELVLSAL